MDFESNLGAPLLSDEERASALQVRQLPALLTDTLYGTSEYSGQSMFSQIRKYPVRVEPKSYFGNERTLLSWVSISLTVGSVSAILLTAPFLQAIFGGTREQAKYAALLPTIFIPMGLICVSYSYFMFVKRIEYMDNRKAGFYNDKVGPVCLATVVLILMMLSLYGAVASLMDSKPSMFLF